MLLGETVPRFRRDLKIERKGESAGLYEVTDPTQADKHFTLYDFELSIARMLDGKRTWQQVLDAGTKLGIPITLDSLEKFERQLQAYGFLQAQGASAAAGDSTWAPREEWSPDLREMFRTALVKFRQNRFDEATGYLNAMLAMDPGNAEAKEVLAEIAEKRASGKAGAPAPVPQLSPPVLTGGAAAVPPRASPPSPVSSAGLESSAARAQISARITAAAKAEAAAAAAAAPAPGRLDAGAVTDVAPIHSGADATDVAPIPSHGAAEAPAPAPEAAPEVPAAPPGPSALESAEDLVRSVPPAAWAAVAGAAVLAVVFAIPLPRTLSASVVLEAPNATVVRAPHNLLVKEVASANGAWIEPGAPLLKLDPAGDPERLKPFETKIAQLQTQLAQTRAAVSKKAIAAWEKNVKQVEKDLAAAKAAVGKAKPKQLAAAQKKVADKERELVEARAELNDATKERAIGLVQQQLDEAVAARDKAVAEATVLNATAGGVLADLSAAPGKHLASGDQIARIVDAQELVVACTVSPKDAASLEAGQTMTVTVKGKPLQLVSESIEGARVSARVKNDQRAFVPGDTGDAKISVAARSIWGRMFK